MKLRTKSKCDLLTEAIIDGIIEGRYRQGEKLPSEPELEQEYQVSRVTVRESLKQLRTMGLVTIQQGDGTIVNRFTLQNYMQPLFPLMVLNSQDVAQLYDARACIEMGAVYEATGHITPEQILRLKKLLEKMGKASAAGDYDLFTDLDGQFHFLINEFSGNQVIVSIYFMVKDVLQHYIAKTNKRTTIISRSYEEHKKIVEAMESGNGKDASYAMREHIMHAKENLLAAEAE